MQDISKNFVNYGFLLESLINIKKMHSSRVIAGYNTAAFYIKNEANKLFVSIFSWVISDVMLQRISVESFVSTPSPLIHKNSNKRCSRG